MVTPLFMIIPSTKRAIKPKVWWMAKKTNMSLKGEMIIILTAHYMEEAEALSEGIGMMKDGDLLFVETKDEERIINKNSESFRSS